MAKCKNCNKVKETKTAEMKKKAIEVKEGAKVVKIVEIGGEKWKVYD